MFTKEEVAAMAAGQDDAGLDALGRQWGFLTLACALEGIEPARDLKTSDFSRENAFAHRAWRHGSIEPVKRFRDMTPNEMRDGHSLDREGNVRQVTEVVFKGE